MTQVKARGILILSVLSSLGLIFWAPRLSQQMKSKESVEPASDRPVLAQVEKSEGKVSHRNHTMSSAQMIAAESGIGNLDLIVVESRASLLISAKGYQIKLIGPGQFLFEMWLPQDPDGPLLIHRLAGQMEMVKEGERGKVFVVSSQGFTDPKGASLNLGPRGLILSPLTLSQSGDEVKAPPPLEDPPTQQTSGEISLANGSDAEPESQSLSNEYLDRVISQQQELFQRCQANALRDQGEVRGQVVMALTISPQGKMENVHVMTSNIQNDKLLSCLVQVFEQIKFKPFSGPSIVRSYPLSFE